MAGDCKRRLLAQAAAGQVRVRTDGRASPTGFPFKVAELPGTLSDAQVYADRPRICDLGVLRVAYRKPDGSIGYRCPAEPIAMYTERRGGRQANTTGRRCLCNALLATAGLPQQRPGGYTEPAIVTAGNDFTGVRHLLSTMDGSTTYTARDAVAYLLGQQPAEPCRADEEPGEHHRSDTGHGQPLCAVAARSASPAGAPPLATL